MASSDHHPITTSTPIVVAGPIVVGAGPSGLAVAASLSRLSVPCTILESSDGIAHLWRRRTYDRLSLHIPKHFCQLPHLPFPSHFPTYPSKSLFLHYLQSYANHFALCPLFNHTVTSARFDPTASLWRVTAMQRRADSSSLSPSESSESLTNSSQSTSESSESVEELEKMEVVEYASRWLVVATGENAEPVVPELKGREGFMGSVVHSGDYKSGVEYRGKRVLVVGSGNSGMEMCLDLCEYGAMPFMSVRSSVKFSSIPISSFIFLLFYKSLFPRSITCGKENLFLATFFLKLF